MKRLTDLVVSSLLLIPAIPVILLLAIIIWVEDRRSPFFFQARYGRGSKIFMICKLRTMIIPEAPEDRGVSDVIDDNRITKVGAVLRRLYLDELPQFFNVWKGDMSLVGPRPIPCALPVAGYSDWGLRCAVKPGMTGMAQIHCTKFTTLRNKFRFDALYVKRKSIWLDIKLIIATAWKIRELLAFTGCTAVILLATLLPIPESNIPGEAMHGDKVGHFLMFLVMAIIAIWFGKGLFGSLKRSVLFGVAWCALLAGGTEFAQSFVPLRNMSLLDFVADMAGTMIAVPCTRLKLINWGW